MAYTGTGTQADPYIPTTITDLYTVIDLCNNNTSASNRSLYIKLTQDLDCADDPDYNGFRTDYLNLGMKINKLYSENGSKIIGLTIKSYYFIQLAPYATRTVQLEGIEFKNCYFKVEALPSGISRAAFVAFVDQYQSSVSDATIDNCKFSVYFNTLYTPGLFVGSYAYCSVKNSSIYCDFYGSNLQSSNGLCCNYAVSINYCNIIINNCPSIDAYTNTLYLLQNSTYTSYIIKNSIIRGNGSNGNFYFIYGSSYCYIAFLDSTFSISTMTGTGTASVQDVNHCLSASNDYTNVGYSDSSGYMNYLSISELQDNQKLLDIGFLP